LRAPYGFHASLELIGAADVTPALLCGSASARARASSRGGAIDLLASLCARARRLRLLLLTLRHPLRDIEPFFLRPTVVRRRNTRLL
jgi:hypothetical protein